MCVEKNTSETALFRKRIKICLLSRKHGLCGFKCYRSPQFSDLDTQQGRMIFLFTHTHTKQVTDALGSTLSKTREGGDLVFFFAVIPPRLLEVLFLGFRCVLLGRKSVVQSLQWEVRVAVGWRLGRRLRGSVGEALAGLLPATGRAPEVPVLHAVYLPALSALSPRLPQADRPSGRG